MTQWYEWAYRWLSRTLGKPQHPDFQISQELQDAAYVEIVKWTDYSTISGEFKRNKVYKQLRRNWPHESGATVGLAIELVYWGLKHCD